MPKSFIVKQGQRYAQRVAGHHRATVWKVGAIETEVVPVPHARLVNESDPLETRTISCRTLTDRFFYELVADAPAPAH
jgi:hypothetical protein